MSTPKKFLFSPARAEPTHSWPRNGDIVEITKSHSGPKLDEDPYAKNFVTVRPHRSTHYKNGYRTAIVLKASLHEIK